MRERAGAYVDGAQAAEERKSPAPPENIKPQAVEAQRGGDDGETTVLLIIMILLTQGAADDKLLLALLYLLF